MSQQEFDRANQEAMDLANHRSGMMDGKHIYSARQGKVAAKDVKAEQVRQMLWTVIQILSCILVASLFIAALMDPSFVVFLANAGILICGMTAAVLVDRMARPRKRS